MQTGAMQQTFAFGGFVLDLNKGLLTRGDRITHLRPKAQAVLTHLARNMGRVVPKTEIMDTVWPDIYVTEDSLTQTIREIRKALEDDSQELLRNVSRRGYILNGSTGTGAEIRALPIVVVLPFRSENQDGEQDLLAEGFAEDLINGLARFGTVAVISRQSSFSIEKSGLLDPIESVGKMGAGYLIDGAIRRDRNNIQISVSLVEVASRRGLWGDRYLADGPEVFAVQRDILHRVIGRLVAKIEDAGMVGMAWKQQTDFTAWELNLRGLALLRSNESKHFEEAERLFETAVAKDPHYALALSHLALTKVMIGGFGSAPRSTLEEAMGMARRALLVSAEQPTCHRVLSMVLMYLREHEAAEYHLRKSLDLNPCDSESLDQMGYLLTLRGRPIEALAWLDRAVLISPVHPNWYDFDRSLALYSLAEYEAAATAIERWPTMPPWIRTRLAACYAMMGDLPTARHHIDQLTATPEFSPIKYAQHGVAFEHPADFRHLSDGVYSALGVTPDAK